MMPYINWFLRKDRKFSFLTFLYTPPLKLISISGFLVILATFPLCFNPVFSQTPQIFEEQVLINNIAAPWGFTFINNNEVLFTEKQGKVFRYVISSNIRTEVTGIPAVSTNGQGGLLDIALHPNFSNNNFVYLTYAVNATGGQTTALGRGTLVGNQLQNFTELFRALPILNSGAHFGSRIVFDNNNLLYMSVGDRGSQDEAQNKNNHLGKVLRFNDDGTVPASNPLVGVPNTRPEIFCWGNRNIQGMAMNPATGEIYAHEHGPRGGDELNLIKPNTNYGWPSVTFGINYNGTPITPDTTLPGMELPLTYWVPSIAPSGMTFIKNAQPSNEADILIGALAGTHIHWLKMRNDKRVSSTRSMNGYARFRDVRQAPDGKLYAMTESPNRFVLLRSTIPTISLVTSATICQGLSSASLVYTATTNNPTTYSIVWNSPAVLAGLINITSASLPASQIQVSIPSGLSAGVYSGTLSVNNGTSSIGYEINLTVNSQPLTPTITTDGPITFCTGGSVELTSSSTTGNTWSNGATTQSITATLAGSYLVTVGAAGCNSPSTATLVSVNPLPNIMLGVIPNVNQGDINALLPYSNTINNPTLYTINWFNIAANAGFINSINVPLPASAITIPVPVAATQGSYIGFLTVSNSICTSLGDTISIIVNDILNIDEKEKLKNVIVYPNPFSKEIILKNSTGSENYSLTNSVGQIIWAGKDINQQDFSNVATGLYFLTIIKDQEKKTLKIVKE